MHPTLAVLDAKLTEALAGMDTPEMQLGPSGKWSKQQIAYHLILTYKASEAVLTNRISRGRPTRASPNVSQRLAQFVVLTLGHFPKGRGAPPEVMPGSDIGPRSGDDLLHEARQCLSRVDDRLVQTSNAFGRTKKSVSHLILGPISPDQWRRFHLIHGLHHIRQITAIGGRNELLFRK